ncbi:MAG: M20 family peptidase [Deltaproteobacteria bacterium]|nr:MAG: M20 family peptidase [Deltaproteobacteria bacterium]
MADPVIRRIRKEGQNLLPLLKEIVQQMHDNPEVSLKERNTSRFLSEILEKEGFSVDRGICGMPTAFDARSGKGRGPKVALLAEMDALPGLGHACGHNIVAASSVGAGIILARLLRQRNTGGSVHVVGCPAEEMGFGKARMVERGFFDGFDAAMMVHPSSRRVVDKGYLALRRMKITFHGKAAHASAYPEEGVNALDALVLFFTSIGLLRQQLKEGIRLHGIITKGGTAPNVIPEETEAYFYLRAKTVEDLETLTERVKNCARGAARSTGCRVKTRPVSYTLKPMLINETLASIYREGMRSMGLTEDDVPRDRNLGSSDIGNVSHACPSIQPLVPISREGKIEIHTHRFREATVTEGGFAGALEGAVLLAYTGFRVLTDREVRRQVKREWRSRNLS